MDNLQKKNISYGPKKKAAIVSIALNVLLTVLKFITYFFTGSIAILADAWHSSSDILTSFAVYFAISKDSADKKAVDTKKHNSMILRIKSVFLFKKMEHAVSFFIGLFMLFVALSIFQRAFSSETIIIRNALISGLGFILFSVGSYVVYHFEMKIGREEGSFALISDSMHSRADMVAALFTGFSLILYHLGLNIDRFAAMIIALFVFSFAIETMVNTVSGAKKQDSSKIFQYRTVDIVNYLLEIRNWKKISSYFTTKLHLQGSSFLNTFRRYRRTLIFSSFLLILILYFSTSFYTVKPFQQAIIERLGRVANRDNPVVPGLHIKLPWPFDSAIKIDSRLVRKMNVGNIVDEGSYALLWTKAHGTEEVFLSADKFLFYPYVILDYRIKDIFAYQYHNEDPLRLLDNIAYDVMTKIFAGKEFYEIAVFYREQLGNELVQRIQSKLDDVSSGLEIVDANLKDIHPPTFLANSFEEVIASYQQKEMIINQAYAYQFEALPQARSKAVIQVKGAESYVSDKVQKAEGEGKRFTSQLMVYDRFSLIFNQLMYYDRIGQVLQESRKILIDPTCGVPELWMNFSGSGGSTEKAAEVDLYKQGEYLSPYIKPSDVNIGYDNYDLENPDD